MTPQRQAVLDAVRESRNHPSATEIFERVRRKHPHIAYGTVYSALAALVRAGLISELKFGNGASRYDARTETHHHALCTVCGRLLEIEVDLDRAQQAAAAKQTGFLITGHHIQFVGVCRDCQEGKRDAART